MLSKKLLSLWICLHSWSTMKLSFVGTSEEEEETAADEEEEENYFRAP
jgi:hypothetical protein